MIRLVLIQIGHVGHLGQRERQHRTSFIRSAMFSAAALCASAAVAHGEGANPGSAANRTYSTVPMHSSDHFVQGKYDKTGIYVPPHYEPVSKPPFHGYFFKKKLPDAKDHKNQKVPAPN